MKYIHIISYFTSWLYRSCKGTYRKLVRYLSALLRILEMSLEWLPALLVILLLDLLACLETPFGNTNHQTAMSHISQPFHSSMVTQTRISTHLSNINAKLPSPIFCGFSSALLAFSNASISGPCALMILCRLAPAGLKPPPVLAS